MSFHFLRPEWLLALLPMILIMWKLLDQHAKKGNWDHFIDPNFRKILLGDQTQNKPFPWAIMGLMIIWLTSIIALSGPSWQSVKMPAEKNLQGSVIVFDLSLSMLADDLKPNRITRARYKIRDLLEAHPEYAMGMVGYAGTAHTIAPISQDNQTLLSLTPSLNPTIMPLYGSNVLAAFEKAQQLLEGAQVKQGHIIWVTDDLEANQVSPLTGFLNSQSISLSILAVGTETGGPVSIPEYGLLKDENGGIVLPKLPYSRLADFAEKVNANLIPIGLDNQDFDALLPSQLQVSGEDEEKGLDDKDITNWLDEGIYLVLLLVPLAALAFRRGWLLSISLVLLLPFGLLQPKEAFAQAAVSTSTELNPTKEAPAEEFDNKSFMPELLIGDKAPDMKFSDVFVTPDRQGYLLWEKQDYARAETRFENPEWKGASYYRLGKYKQAADQFALSDSANSQYNLGNALAKLGQLKQAKQAYEKALQKQPNHEQAKQNLALVDQLIQQIEAQEENLDNQTNPQQESGTQEQNADKGAQQQAGEQNPSEDPRQKNAQQQAKKAQQEGEDGQQGDNEGDGDSPKQSEQSGQAQSDKNASKAGEASNLAGQDDILPDASNEPQNKDDQATDKNMAADTDQNNPTDDAQGEMPSKLSEAKQAESNSAQLGNEGEPNEPETPAQKPKLSELSEQEQAQRAWFNQIPDEPGLFLKRKFDYQYQTQPTQSNQPNDKIW